MSQTETVTIRLPAEVKAKLAALATSTNRSKSWLAAQAIATYVEEQSWQIEQIESAIAIADSPEAEWTAAAKVDEWLTSWSTELDRLNEWCSPESPVFLIEGRSPLMD